jgi:hypothetical protein
MGHYECFSNLLSPLIQLKNSLLKLLLKINAFANSNANFVQIPLGMP